MRIAQYALSGIKESPFAFLSAPPRRATSLRFKLSEPKSGISQFLLLLLLSTPTAISVHRPPLPSPRSLCSYQPLDHSTALALIHGHTTQHLSLQALDRSYALEGLGADEDNGDEEEEGDEEAYWVSSPLDFRGGRERKWWNG
ncbi:hypothetical protein BCR35DRAFT_76616 [Leucosporidium creatinivorum]|uniref:Uncharacterized protein n=1 Tax=Leucosporidium creatinivorum TaxID=106004 RepID=A0A1Y2G488_9BASI|nr:hypothetical protein BCR35DRAFT_76616 [Leucosporidium creatinivorum]